MEGKMDKKLEKIIEKSKSIVFFGGAGVSTESGIPDFRSPEGLYNAQEKYGCSPEEILSHSFFMKHTAIFFDYYKNNLIYVDAEPNAAHICIAELEKQGKLKAVVTQNIDGLHQKAGSKTVYELHGSVLRNFCMDCGSFFELDYILDPDNCNEGIPRCKRCGGVVKPDVVLYQEPLDENCMMDSINAIEKADTLIVGGTSLSVYPAASLIRYFSGNNLVLINKQQTPYDNQADLVINDNIGKVMEIK
jgi:NAD-dependent deacetylase